MRPLRAAHVGAGPAMPFATACARAAAPGGRRRRTRRPGSAGGVTRVADAAGLRAENGGWGLGMRKGICRQWNRMYVNIRTGLTLTLLHRAAASPTVDGMTRSRRVEGLMAHLEPAGAEMSAHITHALPQSLFTDNHNE